MQNLEQIKKIHHEICEAQDRLNKLMNEAVNLGASINIDIHKLKDEYVGYNPYEYKSINISLSIMMRR